MDLYFITGSKNKFEEIKLEIPDIHQLDIDLPEIQELDAQVIVSKKLEEAAKYHPGPFIIEDTSLYFEGMNGLPGPLNKWFIQTIGYEGLYTLAEAFNNFKAEVKTIIGFRDQQGYTHFFEGSTKGTIVKPAVESTFGWDNIFLPEGQTKTYAEMTPLEKDTISHRGKAVRKLKEALGL